MKLALVVAVTTVLMGAVLVCEAAGIATGSAVRARSCGRDSVAARIAGRRVCLRDGQRCNSRRERQYGRYGFQCSYGSLVATWKRLQRPLHIPSIAPGSACPIAHADPNVDFASFGVGPGIGDGHVYTAHYDPRYPQALNVLTLRF